MRTSLLFACLALAILASPALCADLCNSITSCSQCLGNTSYSCGWCSDWNGCMAGNAQGPYSGACNSWHPDTCVGVSVPRVSSCQGKPISPIRIRQLMGGGQTSYNITTGASWTFQSRVCNAVTGCTDWKFEPAKGLPSTSVTLQVESSTVHVNVITSTCPYSSNYCYSTQYAIPFFGNAQAKYGLESGDVGKTSLAWNQKGIPVAGCASNGCTANYWTSPNGYSTYSFTGELTDNCFHMSSYFSDTAVAFVELYVMF